MPKFIAYARANPAWLPWLPWLQREFGWTDRYALNYMRVYELFSQIRKLFGFEYPRQPLPGAAGGVTAADCEAGSVPIRSRHRGMPQSFASSQSFR